MQILKISDIPIYEIIKVKYLYEFLIYKSPQAFNSILVLIICVYNAYIICQLYLIFSYKYIIIHGLRYYVQCTQSTNHLTLNLLFEISILSEGPYFKIILILNVQ